METVDLTNSVMYRFLREMQNKGVISPKDSFLLVFAGPYDLAVFEGCGYGNITASNIDPHALNADDAPHIDASRLPYGDEEFDHVVAHAGLHHASRPHQAVCEMYRVARRSVIFFEAQDSVLVRLAAHAGFMARYEVSAILDTDGKAGGVDGTSLPNYVFRWTARELEKLARSLDPAYRPKLYIHREWNFYWDRIERRLRGTPISVLPPVVLRSATWLVVRGFNLAFGWQGNSFAACIAKESRQVLPWVEMDTGAARLDIDGALAEGVERRYGRLLGRFTPAAEAHARRRSSADFEPLSASEVQK